MHHIPQELDFVIATHQIHPLFTGGAELAMRNLAERMSKVGYKVAVVTRWTPRSRTYRSSIPHVFLRCTNIPGLRMILFMVRAIFAIIRLKRVKVVIFLPLDHSFPCWILKKIGFFTINWARGADVYDPLFPFAVKQSIEASNITFALSEAIKSEMQKYTNRRVYRVPNGFSLPDGVKWRAQEKRAKGRPLRLIYVGRLVNFKRVDVLLKAINMLSISASQLKLDIVGDGPEFTELKRQTQTLALDGTVKLHGYIARREDVLELVSKSDIFIYPTSRGQGMGNAVLEAMALGLPILAYNVGYFRELLGDDVNGWLVDDTTDKQTAASRLARKLEKIMTNERTEIARKGMTAADFVRSNYTWTRVVNRIVSIVNTHLS